MSLAASDAEELSGSYDPAPLPSAQPSEPKSGIDTRLLHILTKAVEELGLDWSSLEEPARLEKWFLPGCRQAPWQHASPFFPEVHEELTRSWHSPLGPPSSSSSTLTLVNAADEKGYERMPPLDEPLAGRLRFLTRPSHAEPHWPSLDTPSHPPAKLPWLFTPWQRFR